MELPNAGTSRRPSYNRSIVVCTIADTRNAEKVYPLFMHQGAKLMQYRQHSLLHRQLLQAPLSGMSLYGALQLVLVRSLYPLLGEQLITSQPLLPRRMRRPFCASLVVVVIVFSVQEQS